MAAESNRKELFDRWSSYYDESVNRDAFPFTGYKDVMKTILRLADLEADQRILDLGVGTGNLSKLLVKITTQVWGADFSEEMLKRARSVLPQSHLIQVDLRSDLWPGTLQGPFDRILSAYTFHEFSDAYKVTLLLRLARESLTPDGLIVIGDISYPTRSQFSKAHQDLLGLWDEEEYYWCAEKLIPQLEETGFKVDYEQVSECGGVYCLSQNGEWIS